MGTGLFAAGIGTGIELPLPSTQFVPLHQALEELLLPPFLVVFGQLVVRDARFYSIACVAVGRLEFVVFQGEEQFDESSLAFGREDGSSASFDFASLDFGIAGRGGAHDDVFAMVCYGCIDARSQWLALRRCWRRSKRSGCTERTADGT